MSSNSEDAPFHPVVVESDIPIYQEITQVGENLELPRDATAMAIPATGQAGYSALYTGNGQTRAVVAMDIDPTRPYGYSKTAPEDTSSDANLATRDKWDCAYEKSKQAWYFFHADYPAASTWENPYVHLQPPPVGTHTYVEQVAAALASPTGTKTLPRVGGMTKDEMRYRQDWENNTSAVVASGSGAGGSEEPVAERRHHKKSSKSSKSSKAKKKSK